MDNARTVGIVGLGTLGKPMARNLVKAGFDVAVHDIREAPMSELGAMGATICDSPAELAARCDTLVSMVLDVAQTREVVFGERGMVTALRSGSKLIIGSTIGPHEMTRIALALKGRDVAVIDIAVTGGYPAAERGTLSIMAGADQALLDEVMPVLRAFGNSIIRAGDVGAGQVAKLANNLVLGINIIALLEGLSLGIAGGVDPRILKAIFRKSSANSYPLEVWDELGPRFKGLLARRQPGATPTTLCKDLHLAADLAMELGVPLHLGDAAAAIWEGGIATGHDDHRI